MRNAGRRARMLTAATMACIAVAGAAGLAGCAAPAGASSAVQLSTAFVPVPARPGTTVAYVVIRNNGAADRLVAARTAAMRSCRGESLSRNPLAPARNAS